MQAAFVNCLTGSVICGVISEINEVWIAFFLMRLAFLGASPRSFDGLHSLLSNRFGSRNGGVEFDLRTGVVGGVAGGGGGIFYALRIAQILFCRWFVGPGYFTYTCVRKYLPLQ